MVPLVELWLPILLGAVFVFLASSVVHMALPMHKKDYSPLPDEEGLQKAMRDAGVKPGAYCVPHAEDMKCMGDPEFIAKCDAGPVVFMQVLPNGLPNIGKSLIQWFLWTLGVGVFVGWLVAQAHGPGAAFGDVFTMSAVASILAYAFTNVCNSIWKGESWWTTFKFMVDGTIYGLCTAAAFAWQWPALV
jgi:hypothetical protein